MMTMVRNMAAGRQAGSCGAKAVTESLHTDLHVGGRRRRRIERPLTLLGHLGHRHTHMHTPWRVECTLECEKPGSRTARRSDARV